ncbi:MAG: aldo/keto reductase [Cyclobacteriaceae bacterium]|nr:aldo/keto reductase [Cyclobacteriaceae bacterium]
MPTRSFGKTGYKVGILSLGGQATLEMKDTEEVSEKIINRAIDLGINYIDTAASYGGGVSQLNIGRVMKTRRGEVWLSTKTHDRTYDGSMKLLEESLKNLRRIIWTPGNFITYRPKISSTRYLPIMVQ